jgi:hypothetical protein
LKPFPNLHNRIPVLFTVAPRYKAHFRFENLLKRLSLVLAKYDKKCRAINEKSIWFEKIERNKMPT